MLREYTLQRTRYVCAICEAQTLANITQLRELLCKIYPIGSCPNCSFTQTISKEHKWVWTEKCDSTLKICKEMLTSEAVLVHHYNSNRLIKLACDAYSYGLEAALSHVLEDSKHPVAFASCTLTKAEKNYSQIEMKPWQSHLSS